MANLVNHSTSPKVPIEYGTLRVVFEYRVSPLRASCLACTKRRIAAYAGSSILLGSFSFRQKMSDNL